MHGKTTKPFTIFPCFYVIAWCNGLPDEKIEAGGGEGTQNILEGQYLNKFMDLFLV